MLVVSIIYKYAFFSVYGGSINNIDANTASGASHSTFSLLYVQFRAIFSMLIWKLKVEILSKDKQTMCSQHHDKFFYNRKNTPVFLAVKPVGSYHSCTF